MSTASLTRLAAAAAGLVLWFGAGAGAAVAVADPDPVTNTSCSYDQVVAAMNAQFPGPAAQFNETPPLQDWLRNFLASPPDQRQQMVQEAQNTPGVDQFVGAFGPLADSCQAY